MFVSPLKPAALSEKLTRLQLFTHKLSFGSATALWGLPSEQTGKQRQAQESVLIASFFVCLQHKLLQNKCGISTLQP